MATETLKSTPITNRDAVPLVLNTAGKGAAARLKEVSASITPTSGVTTGSIYRMVEVPSNCRVSQIIWQAAAMTAGTFDVGVYRNTKDGGAAVSATLFASAVSAAALVQPTDITNESGTYTPALAAKQLWDAAGLTSDPGGTLDICFTSTATITTGALMGIVVRFTE